MSVSPCVLSSQAFPRRTGPFSGAAVGEQHACRTLAAPHRALPCLVSWLHRLTMSSCLCPPRSCLVSCRPCLIPTLPLACLASRPPCLLWLLLLLPATPLGHLASCLLHSMASSPCMPALLTPATLHSHPFSWSTLLLASAISNPPLQLPCPKL